MVRPPLQRLLVNLSHKIKWVKQHGRNYLVAPMTLINPGVLNGSKGPLLYPPEEVASRPQKWNGVPIVVYHPHRLGQPVSAAEPGILDSQGVGEVRNATSNGKLQAEGWFDVQKMQKVNPVLLQRLLKNEAIELSTGLYTDNEDRSGTFNGRPYTAIARNYKPDHLAILPDQTGACSIKDGCGVLVNKNAVTNVWSDEARQAALEARKRNAGGKESYSDRIEGTQAEADREVRRADKRVLRLKQKLAALTQKSDPKAVVDSLQSRLDEVTAKKASLTEKRDAHLARVAALKAKLKAMKRPTKKHLTKNQEFNMNLQNKLSLLVNADPDCIDKENCGSKEDNSCSSTKEENCDNVNNQDSSSSVTLKTDSPTKLVEPDTLKAAIELHDLITGAAESPLKQECLKASEKFLKKFQAHLDDAEEENEDTEVQVGNTEPVTDNQHIQKEGGQHMARKVVLTKNERKAVVDGLITNEACCWEESDREVLNELNDTTLAKLHRQMELVGNAEMSDILGEDDEEDVAVEEEKTEEGESQADGKVAPTGDLDPGEKGEPATNTLSKQDRRDLAFARHYRMAQRKQHIGVITANANNKFTAKQLESMDDKMLANMALLANTQEENNGLSSIDAMSRPNFFGAQGAAVINAKAGADEEPLMLGRIDYKELAANNGRK